MVNHMSADVNQLMTFFYPFAAQLVTGPAMLVAAVVLLWFQIRWATFIGLGILLITTPVTSIFMKVRPLTVQQPTPHPAAPQARPLTGLTPKGSSVIAVPVIAAWCRGIPCPPTLCPSCTRRKSWATAARCSSTPISA